jgi:hypothetical protein
VGSWTDLISALASGAYEDLLGTAESEWLDFKHSPYGVLPGTNRLTEKAKWDLAKDVGAFANRGRALLVIGYKTLRHEHEPVETAVEHTPVNKAMIDWPAYQAVLAQWLYPRVRNPTATWFPADPAIAEGVFVIEIGEQDPADRPLMLRRVLTDEDEVKESGYFAIPMREGDRSELVSAEYVHRRLGDARPPAAPGPPAVDDQLQVATEFEQRLEQDLGWSERPTYVLQAIPPAGGAALLDGFYDRDGLPYALSHPPSLRHSGFNLGTGATPEAVEGGLLVHRAEHHALFLATNGLFTAVGLADPEFLGWAKNTNWQPGQPLVINSLTLVEFTLEFFRFRAIELMPRVSGHWRGRISCRRFREAHVVLGSGPPRDFPPQGGAQATSDEHEAVFHLADDPARDAFTALRYVYALFGLGEDAIPYVEQEQMISEAAITAIT